MKDRDLVTAQVLLLDQASADLATALGVAVVVDVSDPASIRACFATVTARHPELNVLVNNAGIMLPEDLTNPEHLGVAEATVTTNLLGPIRLVSDFVPFLTARPSAVIMNVSSGLGFVPLPLTPTYCATKAAIHSYTQSSRVQLAGAGVQALELIPLAVRTDLLGQAGRQRPRDAAAGVPG